MYIYVYIYIYIYIYMYIYMYIYIYGETGVEKKIVPPSPGYVLHLVLVLFCFTLNL